MIKFIFRIPKIIYKRIWNQIDFLIFYYKFRQKNSKNFCTPKNRFNLENIKIWAYTYWEIETYFWTDKWAYLEIWSYCSIANNVTFLLWWNHIHSNLTTYPVWIMFNKKWCEEKERYSKWKIEIGNDVRICTWAKFLSWVSVWQWAIIAAYSVVTKSVPPYAIVWGNPAKIIKYRFNEEQIAILNQIDFSRVSKDILLENYDMITNQNIDIQKIYHILKK